MYIVMWKEKIPIHKFNSLFASFDFLRQDTDMEVDIQLWDSTYKVWFGDDNFNLKRGEYHSQLHS